MKIEKIRFKNLASLAGEWQIDLTNPVFADAGIFALSGPVGSGKSTIFDAVRLALYGRTSRLDRVNQSDNEIMTRGTKECFAEVVFSNDKGRFLCRWSQHRAARTDNLQKAQHLLSKLEDGSGEGRILTSKLEETRERIRELTGMDFSHFSRAMILPQGQFANFLHASPDERSPILEQITGTGIYAEISRKAHELARGQLLELEALEKSCSGIELLPEERVRELQTAIQEKRDAVQDIRKRYDAGAEIIRAVKTLTSETAAQERITAARNELARELTRTAQLCEETAETKRRIEAEQIMLAPILLKVRELDTRIAVRRENRNKADQELEVQKKRLAETGHALQTAEQKKQQQENRLNGLRSELRKRSADASLGTVLGSLELVCGQLEELEREIAETERQLLALRQERSAQETALAGTQDALRKQETVYAEAEELFRKHENLLNSLLNGDTVPEFFAKKEYTSTQVRELDELLRRMEEAASLRSQQNELRDLQNTVRTEYAAAAALRDAKLELKTAQEQRIVLLEQQRLDQAKIASLEKFRNALQEGKACPLCGSEKHPYAHHLPAPEPDHLPEAREKLKRIETELSDLQRAVIRHEAQLAAGEEKQKLLETALKKAEDSLPDDRAALLSAHRTASEELTRLNAVGAMIETAVQDRDHARSKQEAAQTRLRELSSNAENHIRLLNTLNSRCELGRQTMAEKTNRRQNLRASMTELLKDIPSCPDQPPRMLLAALRQRYSEFERLSAEEKHAAADLEQLIFELRTGAERKANFAAGLEECRKNAEAQKLELNALELQRKQFFGEKDPAEEEKKLAAAFKQAELSLHTAEESRQTLLLKSESLQTSFQESENRTEQTRRFLAGHGVGLPADLSAMETELRKLDEQRQKYLAEIGEHSLLLEQHAGNLERSAALAKQIEAKRILRQKWALLDELIGSAEGKKFRLFVQSLTFETLIGLANDQLVKFTDHFILTADPESGLEFNILDRYRGDELRSTRNLSGGETFLVSLALALGLSRMTRDKVRIDTLFLDEGFGTLDEETLQHALEQLAGLRQNGKLIGIISHAHGIDSAVPVVLHLENNRGRSSITGPGTGFLGN